MTQRNPHLAKLPSSYIFYEVARRKEDFLQANPDVKFITLGVGDTTEHLSEPIIKGMSAAVQRLGTIEGYTGYGGGQGNEKLRQKISERLYNNLISPDDIFISDGTKCDIGRLQLMFGSQVKVAVQDPVYPAFTDSCVMIGQTKEYLPQTGQYSGIVYLPCTPENAFFPDLTDVPDVDLIYFCSPNNPTGIAASREQLRQLVGFAKEKKAILIFDAAYASYIRDPALPRSIYEIPGAQEVAIELGSFSKMAGFSGVRLGWAVLPKNLVFDDGYPVKKDWFRVYTTTFNGASIISQHGGIAALEEPKLQSIVTMTSFYLENARLLKNCIQNLGYRYFGGEHAPYLWVQFPGKTSWDSFQHLLEKAHIVTTPGIGFGPSGEGFVRISAYGRRTTILEAIKRLETLPVS